MNWILLVLISALAGALTRILQKVLLKEKDSDPFAFGFVFQMSVALLFLIYTLVTGTLELPNIWDLWPNLVAMSLLYSLGNLLTFIAFKTADASEVSIIFASGTLWSVLAAMFMLGEKLNPTKSIGVFLVILGIASVNFTRTKWKVNKGHLFALLGAVFFGIAFTNDAFIINRFHSISSYMIIAFAAPAINILFFRPMSIKKIPYFISPKVIPKLLLTSIFYALSTITVFQAYKQGGLASVISPIQQTSIIFTVIISYFFLKEKDRLVNKIIGTILVFTGVLALI